MILNDSVVVDRNDDNRVGVGKLRRLGESDDFIDATLYLAVIYEHLAMFFTASADI